MLNEEFVPDGGMGVAPTDTVAEVTIKNNYG